MKFSAITLSALAAFVPYVSAHGFVSKVVIDGKEFDGPVPGDASMSSAVRMISSNGPVKGADNPDMNCGLDAQLAKVNAPANPGSQLQISWSSGTGGTTWVHNVGPIMNYMASCGGNDCSNFNGTDAKFFKIEQAGKDADGNWVQADTLHVGKPFDLTLPTNLAPGAYLLRHEVIALQGAQSAGGAEFYPSCIQLLIGGNADSSVTPSPTVSFPGAYSDTDPGILVDVYTPSANGYVFPGGPISNIASPDSGSSNSTSPAAGGSGAASSSAAGSATSAIGAVGTASTSVAAPSASATKTCRLNSKRMNKRHVRFASH